MLIPFSARGRRRFVRDGSLKADGVRMTSSIEWAVVSDSFGSYPFEAPTISKKG